MTRHPKLPTDSAEEPHCFARYADDCVILVKSRRAGERVMASVSRVSGKEAQAQSQPGEEQGGSHQRDHLPRFAAQAARRPLKVTDVLEVLLELFTLYGLPDYIRSGNRAEFIVD